jgi:hypothetical protein
MWGEIMLTKVLIKNRTLTSAFRDPEQTLHERWTNKKPDLSHMCEIGCRVFVLKLPKSKNPKVFNCSVECVMVGYHPTLTDTYRCYDRKTGRIHFTHNVDLIESQDEVARSLKTSNSVQGAANGLAGDVDVPGPQNTVQNPPDLDKSVSENEEEGEAGPQPEIQKEAVLPAPKCMHRERGDDGVFPSTRIDAAVVEAHTAKSRAKDCRAEGKACRATIEVVDNKPPAAAVEEEPVLPANAGEYEYWAFSATVSDDELKTWKLKRGMYSLKQGSRSWNLRLNAAMVSTGFKRISVEHSIYSRGRKGASSLVAVHVDDLCIAASTKEEMKGFKEELRKHFEITDLGPVKWILGIHVTRDRKARTISFNQQTYIKKMAARFGLEKAHPVRTPMVHGEPLSHLMSPFSPTAKARMAGVPYCELVGSLMYANVATRPDIAHAVGTVSQFCQNPGELHWLAAKCILRYLVSTKSFALVLGSSSPIYLSGYTDSNYAPLVIWTSASLPPAIA